MNLVVDGDDELLCLDDASDFLECFRAFRPRERGPSLPWCEKNIRTDEDKPYNSETYPHLGAPGGPFDAFDSPLVRTIALQFGTRLGKTFFGLCCLARISDSDPAPAMLASSTEKLAVEITKRLYKMFRQVPMLAEKLRRGEDRQRQDLVELREMLIYVAWARSVSTLADKNVKIGLANEVDKWHQSSTSNEADPLELFRDRFKDFMRECKIIFEGTPTVKHRSRIETKRLAGTNCREEVPCPHCRRYQPLIFGDGKGAGLHWPRKPDGRHDAELAAAEAWYRCAHCHERIDNHHRPWMMRRGVWVPFGATVRDDVALEVAEKRTKYTFKRWKDAPWIQGEALRDGSDASYHLASRFALKLNWGDEAKEWINGHKRPQKRRNIINQWWGETWEAARSKSTPEIIADRLRTTLPKEIVPAGGRILTVSADRQQADGGSVPYWVLAHGIEGRAWLIDWGVCLTLDELWTKVCRRSYAHADGGPPLIPYATIIDSGYKTKETYQFCNDPKHPNCYPCKGSSGDLGGEAFRIVELDAGTRTGAEGQLLIHVNTDYWEDELQSRLDERLPDEPDSLALCHEASYDGELMEQLCNAVQTDDVDKRGNAKLLWVKKDENVPNDFRDAARYGLCLAQCLLDELDGQFPARGPGARRGPTVLSSGDKRPDGRAWLD